MIGEGSIKKTIFFDADGNRLGSDFGLLPITLYKGMIVTIHGHEGQFEVVGWSYHHGHEDEDAGLRVFLKPVVNAELLWA
jgi:hypothetical protein